METRQRLLRSALQLFTEKGIDAATIAEITDSSDLGKGTFYRHFTSKTEVVQALTQNAVDMLVGQMRQPVTRPADLQAALVYLLKCHSEFFKSRWKEFMLLFQGQFLLRVERADTAQVAPSFSDYLAELEAQVAPYVSGGVSPGKVRKLACGLGAFVSGFLSLAGMGISEGELEVSLEPLRRVFVEGATRFLTEKAPSAPKANNHNEQQKGDAANAGQ